jgi:hypothetical protein
MNCDIGRPSTAAIRYISKHINFWFLLFFNTVPVFTVFFLIIFYSVNIYIYSAASWTVRLPADSSQSFFPAELNSNRFWAGDEGVQNSEETLNKIYNSKLDFRNAKINNKDLLNFWRSNFFAITKINILYKFIETKPNGEYLRATESWKRQRSSIILWKT